MIIISHPKQLTITPAIGPGHLQVHRAEAAIPILDYARLPTAHTCFNLLDLPRYKFKQILQQKLLMAIQVDYFGSA